MTTTLEQLQRGQQSTQRQLQRLLDERELLLDELCRTGSVSQQTRCGDRGVNGPGGWDIGVNGPGGWV